MAHQDLRTSALRPLSPTRPTSSWTADSQFTDSAISVQTRSPAPLEKEFDFSQSSPEEEDVGEASEAGALANRLGGLMSELWASEQDGGLSARKRRRLQRAMDSLDAALADSEESQEDDEKVETPQTAQSIESIPAATEADIATLQSSLTATVETFRLRQEERQHLHQLTVEKLESVAQRCLQQEREMQDFAAALEAEKAKNRGLSYENENLSIQLLEIHSESAKKDIAINAMSSTVAGLDGWINGSPAPNQTPRTPRIVTRGKGRFRGRYYVAESPSDLRSGIEESCNNIVLREDVTAWLKGFRDVEEAYLSSQPAAGNIRDRLRLDGMWKGPKSKHTEDDWGDFETVGGT
jgi:hypothetical protein